MTSDASLVERIEALERRLHRLDAIDSIKNLHRTYIRKLADRDWDGMADFFTDDAVTDIRWHGRTESKQELIDNVITVADDGETAYGEWTWHRHVCDFRTLGGYMRVWGPWLEGRYKCEYRLVEGQWLFSDMWFRVVLPDRDPEPDEMAERMAAGGTLIGGGLLDR
jgi:hypothetical protein